MAKNKATKKKVVKRVSPIPSTVDTPTHTLRVKDQCITFIDKTTEEKVSKTYPTEHAVRIICGRAAKDADYLHSVIVKIKSDAYKLQLR